MPAVLGYGTLTAVVLAAFNFTGGKMSGWERDAGVDEYDRKQALRHNRRRPVEETIAEIGEGRGEFVCMLSLLEPTNGDDRCVWRRICRETCTEAEGEVWHRSAKGGRYIVMSGLCRDDTIENNIHLPSMTLKVDLRVRMCY